MAANFAGLNTGDTQDTCLNTCAGKPCPGAWDKALAILRRTSLGNLCGQHDPASPGGVRL
eukprot:11199405-Lingulodinium_polyedra.AAC.1